MFISDDEKQGKEKALEKLKELMMGGIASKMSGLKKPVAASMTIEKLPSGDDEKEEPEEGEDDSLEDALEGGPDDGGNEISEDDKNRIRELYKKYC